MIFNPGVKSLITFFIDLAFQRSKITGNKLFLEKKDRVYSSMCFQKSPFVLLPSLYWDFNVVLQADRNIWSIFVLRRKVFKSPTRQILLGAFSFWIII